LRTFRIVVAYDGTEFVGWQRQASGASIQGLLEDALYELDGRPVTVTGAGRTDAGVHALGQVAAFTLERSIEPDVVTRALNARLPDAVRVLSTAVAAADFHPRFGARAKTYRYRLCVAPVLSPFERRYAWHVGALDIDAMRVAARCVEGRHDFAAFQSAGTDVATTIREIFVSRIEECGLRIDCGINDKSAIRTPQSAMVCVAYEITGDGFLRHMVRSIVGTLVEIGRGRHPASWMDEVIASRDRGAAGPTAPAAGLVLMSVDYGLP
jgi:tRNA pseudouridine38-40 synthase